MKDRDPQGRFWALYAEPLDQWRRIALPKPLFDSLSAEAETRKDDISGLIRDAVDADNDLWTRFAGLDGRKKLYRLTRPVERRHRDGRMVYLQLRVTNGQAERIALRAGKMYLSESMYMKAAVFRLLGWLKEEDSEEDTQK